MSVDPGLLLSSFICLPLWCLCPPWGCCLPLSPSFVSQHWWLLTPPWCWRSCSLPVLLAALICLRAFGECVHLFGPPFLSFHLSPSMAGCVVFDFVSVCLPLSSFCLAPSFVGGGGGIQAFCDGLPRVLYFLNVSPGLGIGVYPGWAAMGILTLMCLSH